MRSSQIATGKNAAAISADSEAYMTKEEDKTLAALTGRYAVLNEVVIAMLAATPNRDSVLRLALRNASELRQSAVEAEHSQSWLTGIEPGSQAMGAWLAGADMEIASYQKLAAQFARKTGV